MRSSAIFIPFFGSLPSRERGLKLSKCVIQLHPVVVAPLAGARIEIITLSGMGELVDLVAPLAGARIEIGS